MSAKALFEVLDKHLAGSRVSYDSELRLMPEDAYIKHVTEVLTEGEGKLTRPQATAQWRLVCVCLSLCIGLCVCVCACMCVSV